MACTSCDSGGDGCGGGCSCDIPLPAHTKTNSHRGPLMCGKCKEQVAALTIGNQSGPMCTSCLHANLLAKFKTAINNNGLILPSDKVLVAFSGGPASRAALELLKEIRLKAQSDAGAAKDRGLKVFGLGAVFVDERTILKLSPAEAQAGVDEISSIFLDGGQDSVSLDIVPLESIFESDFRDHIEVTNNFESIELDGKQDSMYKAGEKVVGLFRSVEDTTGREDLLEYLRMQAIQKVAQEKGYTKVVLGLSTTRIAARVIAATTKGRGFSLSADIQYLDARWPVPVVLPMRDCVARELALFCYFSKFKTTFVKGLTTMTGPSGSLNSLAHSFITLLQEENPAREYTIVRTAAKLKSFSFNEVVAPPNRRRKSLQASKKDATSQSDLNHDGDVLCPICFAPIDPEDIRRVGRTSSSAAKPSVNTETIEKSSGQLLEFRSACCSSCRFQILPDDGQKASEQYGLLPNNMKEGSSARSVTQQKWMRSQIESYLLPEEDDNENGLNGLI